MKKLYINQMEVFILMIIMILKKKLIMNLLMLQINMLIILINISYIIIQNYTLKMLNIMKTLQLQLEHYIYIKNIFLIGIKHIELNFQVLISTIFHLWFLESILKKLTLKLFHHLPFNILLGIMIKQKILQYYQIIKLKEE